MTLSPRLLLTAAALAALLSGCTAVGPGGPARPSFVPVGPHLPPEDATDTPHTYACRDGKRFVAAYALSGRHAVVSAGGRSYRLAHRPGGSGALFASGGVELRSQAEQAQLDGAVGGPYRGCTTG